MKISMTKNKIIGFTEFFGKVNAIVVKDGKIELRETNVTILTVAGKTRKHIFCYSPYFCLWRSSLFCQNVF